MMSDVGVTSEMSVAGVGCLLTTISVLLEYMGLEIDFGGKMSQGHVCRDP